MRADLHTHSTASDGTSSPEELVDAAVAIGLDVLAITDHDSSAGWEAATAQASGAGLCLLRGMEISTRYAGAGVHLLAYLPDPTYPPLAAELASIRRGRSGRLPTMVRQLRQAGVDITEQDVWRQVGHAPAVGRPHVADALVAGGVVEDRAQAFREWLRYGRPGYVGRYATDTEQMVRLVTASGGAAVVAHPWGRGSRHVLDSDALARLQGSGLCGIEVDHQDHTATDRAGLRLIAADLGLVATGSSDFHGNGKVDHDLGCNLTTETELEKLLDRAEANAAASGRVVPTPVGRCRSRS